MVVIDKQAFIFSHSGQYANVRAITDEFKGIPKVPIVHAVIAYDCPQSGQTYLLVVRNALCISSMEHNLIPPFILREAGLVLQYTPKIHCNVPSAEDHSLFDEETGLRIPFTLDGTFSVFKLRSLTNEEIYNVEDLETVFLTPYSNKWDPYDKSYKHNENSFLDHIIRMIPTSNYNKRTLVYDLACSAVGAGSDNYMEKIFIDNACWPNGNLSVTRRGETSGDALEEYMDAILRTSAVGSCVEDTKSGENVDEVNVFLEEDVMRVQVASARGAYDLEIFCEMINAQVTTSTFSAAVGSNMANPQDPDWEILYTTEQEMRGFASATHAEKRKGVSPELIEKIWRIDNKTSKRTIRTTTQHNRQ